MSAWRNLLHRRTVEHELDAELRDHIEREVAEAVGAGEAEADVRRHVRLRSGGLEQAKEACRDVRRFHRALLAVHDLRFALRGLLKDRWFSATSIFTLALGIGATAAIFSVVYGVLLKPLAFDEPDRLVVINHHAPGFNTDRLPQSDATYFTYHDHNRVFDAIGLWRASRVSIRRGAEPESEQALRVTSGLLGLLRVQPALGALFGEEDSAPGGPNRALLTHGYWQRAFGADPGIVGRSITIEGAAYEVAGVLPASFQFLDTRAAILLPLKPDRTRALTGPGFGDHAVARLKDGVTLAQANADVGRMIPLIPQLFPLQLGVTAAMWDGVGLAPNVVFLADDVVGNVRDSLWVLMSSVMVVLVMAWVNVANLLFVRSQGRRPEYAMRAALGASRSRLVSALLSETAWLGLAGGVLGAGFAALAIALLHYVAPTQLPRVDDIAVDRVVLAFTFVLSLTTALLLGILPAFANSTFAFDRFKDVGRPGSDSPRRQRTRQLLAITQIALALVLVILAGLMVRTFVAMRQVHPGFTRPGELQTFQVIVPPALAKDDAGVLRMHSAIATQLARVPGVVNVGLAGSVPMAGAGGASPVPIEDHPVAGTPITRRVKPVGPGYFETMGNPVVAGRQVTWADVERSPAVAVISENLAREYWGEPTKAIGRRLGGPGSKEWTEWVEIVGVVGDEYLDGLNRKPPSIVYFTLNPNWITRNMVFVVRSPRVGQPGFLRERQEAVRQVNASLPLVNPRTMAAIQAGSMSQTSFAMVMLVLSAGVALLLGIVGIYGVMRYVAAQRTCEIGIRMALGAQPGDVRRQFLRGGFVMVASGVVSGVVAALLITRLLTTLLFGVAPTDAATYAAASLGTAAIALLAIYLQARRASSVDPNVVLRSGA